jgi:hypothetical protein
MTHTMNRNSWNLWKHGPMPATNKACPIPIKALLIFVYRMHSYENMENQHQGASEANGNVVAVFTPLIVVISIWLAMCIPSLLTRTRCRIGTILHILFGIYLAVVYWTLICVTLSYAKNAAFLAGITAAVHFAWFCAPAHPDTVHGARNIGHIMFTALGLIIYYTFSRNQMFPHVRDAVFIFVIWAPEIINIILNSLFSNTVTECVNYFTPSNTRHVITKDE